jgi:hypothetical protein
VAALFILEMHMHPGVQPKKTEEAKQEAEKLFPVVLLKNHCPSGNYEIIGYLKEAVKVKDAAGHWSVLSPETFVEGEMKPHTSPGVGFPGKIWAGTHIKLPVEEAKRLVAAKAAERVDVIAA